MEKYWKAEQKKRIIKVAIAAILVTLLIPLIIIGANYMYGADNTDTAKSPYFSDEMLSEFDKGYSQSDQKQLEPLLNDIKMLLISTVNMKPPKENSENLRIIHMTVLRAITQSKLRLNWTPQSFTQTRDICGLNTQRIYTQRTELLDDNRTRKITNYRNQ